MSSFAKVLADLVVNLQQDQVYKPEESWGAQEQDRDREDIEEEAGFRPPRQ